jgi:pimeloyl-ACP methyl ester carboxylesterase
MLSSFLEVGNRKLHYLSWNENASETIIFLPGWLATIDSRPYKKIYNEDFGSLFPNHHCFVFNLTNTYKSDISESPMNIDDYADEIAEIVKKVSNGPIYLAGHSAGGRFAIYFAYKYPKLIKKLILLNSAGLKHKPASDKMLQRVGYYFAKFFAIGAEKKLLRQTFENIYNCELEDIITKLETETLIIWGKEDPTIKISKGEKLHKMIKKSEFKVYENMGHMTVLYPKVYKDIEKFIEK